MVRTELDRHNELVKRINYIIKRIDGLEWVMANFRDRINELEEDLLRIRNILLEEYC